jgi:hypothetical protein
MSFDTSRKQVNNINSDGCGPRENWEKNFGPLESENRRRTFNYKKSITTPEATIQAEGEAGVDSRIDLYITCITREIRIKGEGTIPSSLNPRKR